MSYTKLFYHIVWATKDRTLYLSDDVESEVYQLLRVMSLKLKAHIFAMNGMPEHVHQVVSLPPTVAIATFLGRVKGASSTLYNKSHPNSPMYWQDEYAAFSCDAHCLPKYIAYVENQKQHHQQNTWIPVLECTDPTKWPTVVKEQSACYDPFMTAY
jgi:putative transposase